MVAGVSHALNQSQTLSDRFSAIRQATEALCATLEIEDFVVQTMPDVSPTKWHLAHVTWFFEHFVLLPRLADYRVFDSRFEYLFNSYYYSVGQMHRRPQRGFLSRPTVAEIRSYRQHVDEAMLQLLERSAEDPTLDFLVTLGMNHEQQHQELLLTDIKHVLGCNPLTPTLRDTPLCEAGETASLEFVTGPSGLHEIGATGGAFCFDNETPAHKTLLHEHQLANRPVTNGEYRTFIESGAYDKNSLWLSDGWATVREQGWNRPLYWSDDFSRYYTLGGMRDIDDHAPVCHVSFYEADAFARWAGARLPTEAELEVAARDHDIKGNFVESGYLHPAADDANASAGFRQMFGDVWEWTQSAYSSYPGFQPLEGSLGEYNGKFMSNQMVLRGGSCATPTSHMRATYRNFFYPNARWQFSGIRLAKST